MSDREILLLMDREDCIVVDAVADAHRAIGRASRWMADALALDRRVFFVGAGTSGRLGVLEAAECPPTFGTRPEQIVAIIAGGDAAVFAATEGSEDEEEDARRQLRGHALGKGDLMVGISASSVTPFVRGALGFAASRQTKTVLITCGKKPRGLADLVILARVGPEILSGSTRLKAATATKLILNRVSLLAMIRLNKVFGPYMVDLRAGSNKLRDRATRIVTELVRCDRARAEALLRASKYHVKTAVVMGLADAGPLDAKSLLDEHNGNLRQCLAKIGVQS